MSLSIVFMGSPRSPCRRWRGCWTRGYEVALVLAQPDRPAGPTANAAAAWPRSPASAACRSFSRPA